MIYLDRIFKKFSKKEKPVLNNLNLSVSEGEFVSIVGPSGSGKTTILRLILGEIKPTSGDVFFQSINVNKLKSADIPIYRKQIGTVFQDFKLFADKTVFENLAFMMEIAGLNKRSIKKHVHDALELVGLASHRNRFPAQLSGGEKQRIAFARAIINDPNIIMADEPTAWLDEENTENVMDILTRIHEAGTSIIMTTHQKHLLKGKKKDHRTLFLEEGKIIGQDDDSSRKVKVDD